MEGKSLTISVAAYNSEGWLSRCLDSFLVPEILDQLEVIIVNDGSTDKTKEIAEEYCRRYPVSFSLVNKKNGGHGSTINTSIRLAKGKYYKLVDSDDWVDKEGLKTLVFFLKKTDADLVLNRFYETPGPGEKKHLRSCIDREKSGLEEKKVYPVADVCEVIDPTMMHGMTFRTDVLKRGWIDISEHCFYVDTEFVFFNIAKVRSVAVSDTPVYYYLNASEVQSMNPYNISRHIDEMIHVKKRIESFYAIRSKTLLIENKTILDSMLSMEVPGTYRFIMSMDDHVKSKHKFIAFDKWQQKKFRNIYLQIKNDGCLTFIMADVMRFLRYRFYVFFRMIMLLDNKRRESSRSKQEQG